MNKPTQPKVKKPTKYDLRDYERNFIMPEWQFKSLFLPKCIHIESRRNSSTGEEFKIYGFQCQFTETKESTCGNFFMYYDGLVYQRQCIGHIVQLIKTIQKVEAWYDYEAGLYEQTEAELRNKAA